MQLGPRRRRPRGESVVPMINIVFLLLIFFLLTATIAPPDPFPVSPPELALPGAPPDRGVVLHVAADGALALGAARDAAVWQALEPGAPLTVNADAALPGEEFAALLRRLSEAGVEGVSLVVVRGGP